MEVYNKYWNVTKETRQKSDEELKFKTLESIGIGPFSISPYNLKAGMVLKWNGYINSVYFNGVLVVDYVAKEIDNEKHISATFKSRNGGVVIFIDGVNIEGEECEKFMDVVSVIGFIENATNELINDIKSLSMYGVEYSSADGGVFDRLCDKGIEEKTDKNGEVRKMIDKFNIGLKDFYKAIEDYRKGKEELNNKKNEILNSLNKNPEPNKVENTLEVKNSVKDPFQGYYSVSLDTPKYSIETTQTKCKEEENTKCYSLDSMVKFELDYLYDLFEKKNSDYGSSFTDLFNEFGLTSSLIRMQDKLNRLKSLTKNNEINVKDESIKDTLRDLANYAILTICHLD